MESPEALHRRFGYTPTIDGSGHDSQFIVMDLKFFRRSIISNVRLQQYVTTQSFRNRISGLSRSMRRREINDMYILIFHIPYFKAASILFISSANSSSL